MSSNKAQKRQKKKKKVNSCPVFKIYPQDDWFIYKLFQRTWILGTCMLRPRLGCVAKNAAMIAEAPSNWGSIPFWPLDQSIGKLAAEAILTVTTLAKNIVYGRRFHFFGFWKGAVKFLGKRQIGAADFVFSVCVGFYLEESPN